MERSSGDNSEYVKGMIRSVSRAVYRTPQVGELHFIAPADPVRREVIDSILDSRRNPANRSIRLD